MKHCIVLLSLFLCSILFALEIPALPNGGNLHLEKQGTVSLEVPLKELRNAQDRLQFQLEANRKNGNATLTVFLQLRQQGKLKEIASAPLHANVSLKADLPFNSTFQLQDASYSVTGLRFLLKGGNGAKVRIRSLRLGSSDELTAAETEFRVSSAFRRAPARNVAGVRPVRVYFEFDNTDRDRTIRAWPSRNYLPDANPSGGFSSLLLEHADGIAEAVSSPEEADVIVYSRARKGGAKGIPEMVKNGKRLIVYGQVPDPELAAVLPLTFRARDFRGLPPREPVSAAEAGHPLLRGEKLAETDYGRFFTTARRSGKTLLACSSGEPLLAEDGNILHFATGIGTLLLPRDGVFYDRMFLRAVCVHSPAALNALDRRIREDRLAAEQQEQALLERVLGADAEKTGFRAGMSEQNAGRFGWLISEGLLCGSIGRDLTVANGPQFYRFDDSGRITAALHDWKHRVLSGKVRFRKSTPSNTDPLEKWSGTGTVEYSAEIVFPNVWRGKPIFFEVEEGIDDTDKTFFNGAPLGATGTETPRYWSVRRAYPIDPNVVKWGKNNRITVQVTNLRGDACFNSAPRILVETGRVHSGSLRVMETDWVHKKYELDTGSGRQEVTLSLLSPFVLHRISGNETNLVLEEKTAQYAAYSTDGGIRVIRLEKQPDFYLRSRDGNWNAPWLLLFRKNWERARPLLLVFEKQPDALRAGINGRFISGLHIQSDSPLGTIACGWPWGSTPVNASGWTGGLPDSVLRRIAGALPFALNYPVGCDEVYRIDRGRNRVEIVNRFRYRRISDAWKTPVETVATLPPLVGLALENKKYVIDSSPVRDLGIHTDYGPLYGASGTDRIAYTLPLPPESDIMLTGVRAEPELRAALNRLFEGGVRWSRGGRVRCEEFTPAYPEGEKRYPEVIGIPLFTWNYGLSVALQGYFILTPENRLKLQDRITRRFLLPLEQYQYKFIYRNREEPFTGLRYPILFNHSHPNSTRYASGIGSPVIFGDNNEGCTMLAWLGRQCADVLGEVSVIRNSWNFIRYGMRSSVVLDDYAWHSSACREFGGSACIDMLNCEYAGFVYFARLARTAGDPATEDDALYRAAKRGIPTLMRLRFLDYIDRALPQIPLEDAGVCTGFAEDHFPIMRMPTKNNNFLAANDLFDFSQGFPGALHWLYVNHALPEVRAYLHKKAFPALFGAGLLRRDYLPPLMLYADDGVHVREKLDSVLKKESSNLMSDWPGIRMPYQGGLYLWRTNGRILLKEFRHLALQEAEYDPASRKLRLRFRAREGSRLAISADLKAERIEHNGKVEEPRCENGLLVLPSAPGNHDITVVFR